jgi:hypothetical protein
VIIDGQLRIAFIWRSMRFLVLILGCLLIGCKTTPKSEKAERISAQAAAKPKRKITTSVVAPPPSRLARPAPQNTAGTAPASPQKPAFRPVEGLGGRVSGVREDLRFIVIDYGSNKLPPLDQRLNVYRGDQKVAEIKVSGPYLGSTVVADILKGEAQFGDFVRPE